MRYIVVGAAGKMGRCMAAEIAASGGVLAAAVDRTACDVGCPIYQSLESVVEDADVLVDFSSPQALGDVLSFALKRKMPLVIATTGHSEEDRKLIEEAAVQIPIFFSPNLSYGAAVFAKLVRIVAEAFPYADVEIVETHHRTKRDAPSGTALRLGGQIIAARKKGRIVLAKEDLQAGDVGISSLRLGRSAGKHEVIFDTAYQRFTLSHEAHSRALYTRGAVNAAAFIAGAKAGLYDMSALTDKDNRRFL